MPSDALRKHRCYSASWWRGCFPAISGVRGFTETLDSETVDICDWPPGRWTAHADWLWRINRKGGPKLRGFTFRFHLWNNNLNSRPMWARLCINTNPHPHYTLRLLINNTTLRTIQNEGVKAHTHIWRMTANSFNSALSQLLNAGYTIVHSDH